MHKDETSKRQEVHAGLIDNMFSSFSHLRQHFKPKGWIMKCVSRVDSYHVKTSTRTSWRERIYSVVSHSFTGNRRNKCRKMNSSGKVLSMLRRMAKPTPTTARAGFYLLGRTPATPLGPRMLTLPSSLHHKATRWFLGRAEAQTFVLGFQSHLCTPSSTRGGFLRRARGLDWAPSPLQRIEENTPRRSSWPRASPGKATWVITERIR